MKCCRCKATAAVALPSHNAGFCTDCFLGYVTRSVKRAIHAHHLLSPTDRILVAISGGKDSLALIQLLASLGYNVYGLHIDLSILAFSEQARATVETFCAERNLPLVVIATAAYGLPIPVVKAALRHRPICSICGKIKRYFFNKITLDGDYTVLATGHNLDDETSRLFANILRWDIAYLSDQGPFLPSSNGFAAKIKPLYRLSEFETAAYCFLTGIQQHTATCPYSKGATFTKYKDIWTDLEDYMPGCKLAFYENFLRQGRAAFQALKYEISTTVAPCERCGYPTSATVCSVCRIRENVGR